MSSLSASLGELDLVLAERFLAIPKTILQEDYTALPGSDKPTPGSAPVDTANSEKQYRLLGSAAIFPWGSMAPWLLPPTSSSPTPQGGLNLTLKLPHSRVRHYLSDAAIYAKFSSASPFPTSNPNLLPRLTRAVLRSGEEKPHGSSKVLQSFDSEFACNVALIYKRGFSLDNKVSYDPVEKSTTLNCPFYFAESPVLALPLFLLDAPVIEYSVGMGEHQLTGELFVTEFISSPGEDLSAHEGSKKAVPPKVVQYLPSITTFRSSGTITNPNAHSVTIPVNTADKLARCLYVRVYSATNQDIATAVASITVQSSTARKALPLPGSLCRSHFKTKFGFPSLQDALAAPYYVIPYATAPRGQTADYGLLLPSGSRVVVELNASASRATNGVTVEVAVETFTRVAWQRSSE